MDRATGRPRLIQFKSVSKAWLIPIPPFSDFCMEYVPSNCQRTLRDRGRFVESYSKLLPFQPTGWQGRSRLLQRKRCVAILVNPNQLDPIYAVLAFNPVESPPNNTNNNYKIVRFASSASTASITYPPELDVFSSVTGKWVNHPVPLQPEPELYGFKWLCKSVYLDGVLYMLSYTMYLLCFDLNVDNLNPRAVKLPNKGKALGVGFIGMSKDCFYYSNHVENAVLVWSLDHDHKWILKHSICRDDYRLSPLLVPCALHPTSEVIFIAIPRMIFSYNLKTNQFNVFYILQEYRNLIDDGCFFFPYSRCLVVLNDFTQWSVFLLEKGDLRNKIQQNINFGHDLFGANRVESNKTVAELRNLPLVVGFESMAFNCCCDWSSKLPDELTVEILCRLPEKPLIQFKSVSKAWYLLISDVCVPRISSSAPLSGFLFRLIPLLPFSDFLMEYVPSDCRRTLLDRGRFVESYSKLLPFQPTARDVLDCCNGLLLILHRSSVPPSVPSQYYVCNPATKQCVAIPVNPNHLDPKYAVLAFNPVESPQNNTNNNNYKIVRLASSASTASVTHPPELDVFSSVTGKWVNHPVPLQPEPELYGFKWLYKSVYLDGVLYMLSYSRYLLCFDLNADNLNPRAVKLPNKGKALGVGFIGMSKDCFYYSNHVENAILVWSLDHDRSLDHDHHWILKHSICIDDLVRFHHGRILDRYRLSPLLVPCALHPTSEVIFIAIPRLIFSYNLKTNQFNVFYILQENRNLIDDGCFFFPYSRCLVVLNDFTQMNDMPRNKGLEVGVTI
ncbi:unnamed protein product [Camellia sinensis]